MTKKKFLIQLTIKWMWLSKTEHCEKFAIYSHIRWDGERSKERQIKRLHWSFFFFRDWHRAISVAIDVCISSFFKILVPSFVCLLQTCLLYWLTGNIVALTVTLWSFKYTPHSEPRDSLCSAYLWELGTTEHSSATTVHKNKTKKKNKSTHQQLLHFE